MTYFDKNALKLSHEYLRQNVKQGQTVIDATAGKGRDTLLLANLVGENGTVYAFDIQPSAIEASAKLIKDNGKSDIVRLICDTHEKMNEYVPSADGVVFNLGYLPSSDHEIKTTKSTSINAINTALSLITDEGFVSICLYYGGISGFEEHDGVLDFLRNLDQKEYTVAITEFANRKNCPPIFAVIEKNR